MAARDDNRSHIQEPNPDKICTTYPSHAPQSQEQLSDSKKGLFRLVINGFYHGILQWLCMKNNIISLREFTVLRKFCHQIFMQDVIFRKH